MASGTGAHYDQADGKIREADQSISTNCVFTAGHQEPACRASQQVRNHPDASVSSYGRFDIRTLGSNRLAAACVRGYLSGTLKKKPGLTVTSLKEDCSRRYRLTKAAKS